MAKDRGVYLRGKVWWIRYTIHGVRHFEPVGPNKRHAVRARERRLAEVEDERFGVPPHPHIPTFREFVETKWRPEIAIGRKPSTLRGYETALAHHLLPDFGPLPLQAITRAAVRAFIARKSRQQRTSYSRRRPNPNRPTLAPKTILNLVALLSAILESAASDYELLPHNPLRGILRHAHFPTQAYRPRDRRPQVLEPDAFRRAIEFLAPRPLRMVLTATLTGLRWGEQVALRIEEDMDYRHNHLRITRAFYRRIPQTPKTEQSVRDIDMGPTVRRIMQLTPWTEGLVFSPDGVIRIGDGSWLKRQWRQAQLRAGIRRPIRWHDLRHQFVSLLIAAGKSVKYIAQ
jgi:integrase